MNIKKFWNLLFLDEIVKTIYFTTDSQRGRRYHLSIYCFKLILRNNILFIYICCENVIAQCNYFKCLNRILIGQKDASYLMNKY